MSRLTGQSPDHETRSCARPGATAPVRITTNCWKAKTFSFSFDFLQNQVTLDCDLLAASHKNEETVAGQEAHTRAAYGIIVAIMVARSAGEATKDGLARYRCGRSGRSRPLHQSF